jgi:alanyl-tRNA synthetase
VAVVRILHEGSIGAGMRRVEALVGPDALREINAERALLDGLVAALGSKDPQSATEHARRLVEKVKRLESELGSLRRGDRDSLVTSLAGGAQQVGGVALVVAEVPGEDPAGLRELAVALRSKLEGRGPAAVVVGNGEGGKAMLVAAVTAAAIELGVTAPALLTRAAATIGGGAGGKDNLANAGGKRSDAVGEALGDIPARLHELAASVPG